MARRKKGDFEWGARSALQKAIRRGDVAMGRTATRVLFEWEPSWFIWRMPAIVPEEQWPKTAENSRKLMQITAFLKEGKKEEAAHIAENWVAHLCTLEKNRDANALSTFMVFDWTHRYLQRFRREGRIDEFRDKQLRAVIWCFKRHISKKGLEAFDAFDRKAMELGDDDLIEFVRSARYRYNSGGMDGDRIMLMAACVLAITEYPWPELKKVSGTTEQTPPYSSEKWPWYVYDMHNARGKRAMRSIMKYGRFPNFKQEQELKTVWFAMESSKCNKHAESSFWWPLYLEIFQKEYKITEEEWKTGLGEALRFEIEGTKSSEVLDN